jgi:hypothetical protein
MQFQATECTFWKNKHIKNTQMRIETETLKRGVFFISHKPKSIIKAQEGGKIEKCMREEKGTFFL